MKKQDLKDGMILEVRCGERFLLTNDVMRDFDSLLKLEVYSVDLKNKLNRKFDIDKIYKINDGVTLAHIFQDVCLTLIWEREEIKLTEKEVEVLKALKTLGYEWLARDNDGVLYGYDEKPTKYTNDWSNNYYVVVIQEGKDLFNFIKWEDKEPIKIDDLLNKMVFA